jgi:DNA-binding CsgD family transcriptional regulator
VERAAPLSGGRGRQGGGSVRRAAAVPRTLTPAWQANAAEGFRSAGPRWPLEWGLWILGLLNEADGDDTAARAALDDAWALASPLRYFLGHRTFAPDVVRVALRAGDSRQATVVTGEVEAGARRAGTTGARAAALRCRGLLGDDADTLRAAAEAFRATPHVLEMAFTLEEAGMALGRRGRRAEAVTLLDAALFLFEGVGAARVVSRIDAALRSLGSRPRRVSPRATTGWATLTPTELHVARLATEGLTNRQIGDRLFVSRRTVETHLAHAFRKLGVSTRSQLAAEVARRA